MIIAILVFICITALFFPTKMFRAMTLRRKLLAQEESDRVKRKGILKTCTPYVMNLLTIFHLHISDEKRQQLQESLIYAGYEEKMSVDHFVTFQVLSAFGGFLYAILLGSKNIMLLVLAPLIALLAFQVPTIWLKERTKVRQDQIRRELPHILNSIAILCEAGMNLFASIKEVADTKKGALSNELQRVVKHVGAGMSQSEALEQLARRCQVDEVSRFVSAITQTLERGSAGITAELRRQASEVWTARKKRAQQLGEQASMKLFLPLVLLAFPAMMIFILGPVAINLFEFFM